MVSLGFTLSQATKALRESRSIALLYFRPLHGKGVRDQRHAQAAPYPRERLRTHCTGGWVGLRAGLDWYGKSRPTGIRFPDRPARRQSLYRLRYPARKDYANEKLQRHRRESNPRPSVFYRHTYEGWNFNSGNYLFTTDTK